MIKIKVDKNLGGQRLDRFMRKCFSEEPLSKIFGAIRKKNVKINGKTAKGNQRVEDGDEVSVYDDLKLVQIRSAKEALNQSGWTSKEIKKTILAKGDGSLLNVNFENDDYIVMNKPAGTPSQPGSGQAIGSSLVEQLWNYLANDDAYFRPALAHRLDKDTSGLIVGAKNAPALRALNEIVRNKQMYKEYTALIKGKLPKEKGSIKVALERTDSAKGAKMHVRAEGTSKLTDEKNVLMAKKSRSKVVSAVTNYEVLKVYREFTLVKVVIETGRMHQIRAHFAYIGCPLAGDSRYGDFTLNRDMKKKYGLNRLFLHSSRLEWPWKKGRMKHKTELAKDLEVVLAKLK